MTSYYLDVLKRKFGAERRQPFHSVQVLILIKLITLYGAKNDGLRPDADGSASHHGRSGVTDRRFGKDENQETNGTRHMAFGT